MTELMRVPSKPFYNWLDKIADNEQTTRESFEKAVTLAREEKFTDLEIALLMKDYLKDKISKSSLWRWTKSLEPKEDATEIEQSTSESVSLNQIEQNNDPEQPESTEDEEPTPLELAEIRIQHLEEALKKTEQFKPATALALERLPEVIESATKKDEEVHSWLKNAADGIGSFYYDSYGIDLFKNRELSQLKNSGVKVFKRLYFEV